MLMIRRSLGISSTAGPEWIDTRCQSQLMKPGPTPSAFLSQYPLSRPGHEPCSGGHGGAAYRGHLRTRGPIRGGEGFESLLHGASASMLRGVLQSSGFWMSVREHHITRPDGFHLPLFLPLPPCDLPLASQIKQGTDAFLLLASDGVWEYLSSGEVAELVGRELDWARAQLRRQQQQQPQAQQDGRGGQQQGARRQQGEQQQGEQLGGGQEGQRQVVVGSGDRGLGRANSKGPGLGRGVTPEMHACSALVAEARDR